LSLFLGGNPPVRGVGFVMIQPLMPQAPNPKHPSHLTIALAIASACLSINSIGGKSILTCRKALKISRVGTSLSRPVVLFTAFSAIYRIVFSKKIPLNSI
jgi:hypothetical protein